jgi:hypothetical protein
MADNFLEYHSWFDEKYERFLRGRYYTLRTALNLLIQRPLHTVVETGCTRLPNDSGSGYSTYIFGDFIAHYGGHLTTIDIEPDNIRRCKEITKEFEKDITYINSDSLIALGKFTRPIDLLYLDSMDIPEEGDATAGQEHNLKEFKVAESLLHEKSIILIDDNDMENGGKSRLTKKYLKDNGYRLLLNLAQSLWIK